MRSTKLERNKLTGKVRRLIVYVFLLSSVFLNTSFLVVNYFYLSDYKDKQVSSWVESFPKSIVSHLLEFNYQPISSKLEYVKSTDLFSSFVVVNRKKKVISSFGDIEDVSSNLSSLTEIKDNFGNTLGFYGFQKDTKFIKKLIVDLITSNLVIIILCLLFINFLFSKILKYELSKFDTFIESLDRYVDKLKTLNDSNDKDVSVPSASLVLPEELANEELFEKSVSNLVEVIDGLKQKEFETTMSLEKSMAKEEVALQVAHDIRSPLAALKMATGTTSNEKDVRGIIHSAVNRISDIANNLLLENRRENNEFNEGLELIDVATLIEPIISEKRMQFREHTGLEIDFRLESSHYGLFCLVDKVELIRVISNLINNSVEALPHNCGKVWLSLDAKESDIRILVHDNGMGIKKENLDKVTLKNSSFGKENGNGLGLFHAKNTLKLWEGSLELESKEGMGTCISLIIPKQKAPKSFVSNLKIGEEQSVIIIDDDISVHKIWEQRLKELKLKNDVLYFSSPEIFKDWFKVNQSEDILYFVDYEFLGSPINGIELVRELNIVEKSFLVSSHYSDDWFIEKCDALNLRRISKNQLGFIPIEKKSALKSIGDVLIDDDELVRLTWASAAKRAGVTLNTYSSTEGFRQDIDDYNEGTRIYIDSNLGDGIKGEEFALELSVEGFNDLYLATGYEKESFDHYKFLKGVIGKLPPYELN